MWKKRLLMAAFSSVFLFEGSGGCTNNRLLWIGGAGLAALVLSGSLGRASTN